MRAGKVLYVSAAPRGGWEAPARGTETHLCSVLPLLLRLPALPRGLDLGLCLGFPLALRREVLFTPSKHALAVFPALVRNVAAVRDLG